MVKMKHIKVYDHNDCPDHLIEEVDAVVVKIAEALSIPLCGCDPNIILSALNRFHAAMIVTMISSEEGELRKAAIAEIKALIGNIESLSGITVIEDAR